MRARRGGGSGQTVAAVAAAAVDKASRVRGPGGKDSNGCGGGCGDGWTERERKASPARPLISSRSVRNPMLRPREGEKGAKKLASVLYASPRWTGGGGGGNSDGGGK